MSGNRFRLSLFPVPFPLPVCWLLHSSRPATASRVWDRELQSRINRIESRVLLIIGFSWEARPGTIPQGAVGDATVGSHLSTGQAEEIQQICGYEFPSSARYLSWIIYRNLSLTPSGVLPVWTLGRHSDGKEIRPPDPDTCCCGCGCTTVNSEYNLCGFVVKIWLSIETFLIKRHPPTRSLTQCWT